jgi:hypothetical protein
MSETGWRKSSRSGGDPNSDCVEARAIAADFQVRDSKLGDGSPVFDLQAADFSGLLRAAGRGQPFSNVIGVQSWQKK